MEIVNVGDVVTYVDEMGVEHKALVNQVWHDISAYKTVTDWPGVNLVYVNTDESMKDQYGRQIQRATSVVHQTNQPAPGRYWRPLVA